MNKERVLGYFSKTELNRLCKAFKIPYDENSIKHLSEQELLKIEHVFDIGNKTLLNKCTKEELNYLCKYHIVENIGTKKEIVQNLVNKSKEERKEDITVAKAQKSKKSTSPKLKKAKCQTDEFDDMKMQDIKYMCKIYNIENKGTKKLLTQRLRKRLNTKIFNVIQDDKHKEYVHLNKHNKYEHPETKLVFDKDTKKAIGKQYEDGSVGDLTANDIELCREYRFDYFIPMTL